jgi:hypothetical protein
MYDTDPKHVSKCQGEKNVVKGGLGRKELQQHSCTDALTSMGICNVRAYNQVVCASHMYVGLHCVFPYYTVSWTDMWFTL